MDNKNRLKPLTGIILLMTLNLPCGISLVNSPKIITKDGNLIFESGLDRNISFRLSGKSRLNVNDEYDLLDLLIQNKKGRTAASLGEGNEEWTEEEEAILKQLTSDMDLVKRRVFGPNGLEYRFYLLQNRTRVAQQLLRRYTNRLQQTENRVKILQERLEKQECRSNPCENGGICFNIFGGFMCKCSKNFEGPTCNQDVNECALYAGTDLGCQNGAQCVNQFGSYSCICQPGWYGIHCTQRKGDCMQSSNWELCGHGVCVSSNDTFGYKCICDQGWRTNDLIPACTVDVDECAVSHTVCSTKCINLPGSFTCAPCPAGLTGNGISCRDLDECAENNGGCSLNPKVHCINSYGSSHCGECPLGWMGDGRTCVRSSSSADFTGSDSSTSTAIGSLASCTSNNICHPLAACNEVSNTVVCSCPAGMIGSGIGMNGCVSGSNKNCLNQPCKNGGTCLDSGDGYFCVCPSGFMQPNCTAISNACMPNPCLNGGRCVAKLGEQYQCQCTPGYTGKRCGNRFNRCGGVLADPTGRLTYPLGSPYEHNVQCAWIIRTSEALVLNVTFRSFELEDGTDCRYDWLQINDGRTAADQIIGRFCGSHMPNGGNIISSTNNLYLWFRSDNSTAAQGFDLEWQSIPPQCGGVFTVETHGTIATPGSPGNYPKNRDCRWHLKAPRNKRLKFTFFSLNIEKHDSCNYDYVEIKDAISGHDMEKYCSSSHPQPLLLPTNEVNIHFHSDNVGSDTGFQIYYSTEERIPGCGGVYTLPEGHIQSPLLIEDSIACEYEIRVPSNESIILNFEKLKMATDDCIKIYVLKSETLEESLYAKYCGDYKGTLPLLYIEFNKVLIKFYGESGAEFKVYYRSSCSFTYQSEEGVLYSPNYPNITKEARFCLYTINTEPNTVISLYFDDFDVKDSSLEHKDCVYTYLAIDNNIGKSAWDSYCNEKSPLRDFVTKHNLFYLHFRTSPTSSGRGFKIKYKAIPIGKGDCGSVYTKPGYTIRLPTDEEGLYMHDMECYWVIKAPPHKYIFLNWKSFKLEESSDCNYDYVEVYDNLANKENSRPLGRYCDAHPPESMLTHSGLVTIKFVSDAFDAMEGFELNYEFVDAINQCGGYIYSSTGKINSPNWPGNYTENLDCHWILNTPPGSQLELKIEIFDVEYIKNCSHDWLDIRNGGSNQSTLIGRFCGNISSIPRSIPSFTNQMFLHFHTDSFVSLRGFQLRWQVFSNGCGGNLKAKAGVITSPFYPKSYPNEADCEWRIHVPAGSVIQFKIEDLALETSSSCHYDTLQLYDGSSMSHHLLVSLCDDITSSEYVTTHNEALVRFISDESNRERGFMLSFKANCSIVLNKIFGVIESPNYGEDLNPDNEEVNCTWTIKAPKGNRINLEFSNFFSLEEKQSISIQDGNQTYQIKEMYHNFNSSSDTLILKQSNNLVSFQLEYVMVGCIKTFHEKSGNFTSPKHPKPYDNNLECLWEIFTSPGQGIEVTVADLDVEDSVNCTKDALLITSHPKNPNVKERHCGRHTNLVITSASHYLQIKFYSDGQGNGKGFTVNYKIIKTSCGGVLSSKTGIITSPHYPNNYPQNSDCEWSLRVSPYHSITFTMIELDVEDFSSCSMDYVEASETLDGETTSQLFKVCGTLETKNVTTWRSSTNSVTVRFHTDDTIASKGFKLSYEEDCGSRIILENEGNWDRKEISVTKHAAVNQTCQWQLETKDLSEHVALTISHVHLNFIWSRKYRTENECSIQGGIIYEGPSTTGPVRAKFCKVHPPYMVSYGHALTVTVPLSVLSEFEATVSRQNNMCGFSTTVFGRSLAGKFSSPYYPSSYPVNMQCFWDINASAGNRVVLVIESIDLEDSESCNNDYVEVRLTDMTAPPLGVFCGNEVPGPIGPAEVLLVTFNSDSNEVVGNGFVASYNYVMHNEVNGTTGVIESPGYPTKFHSDDEYSWRITVDKNYVILLNIKHILDEDIRFIKVYDGYTDIGAPIEFDNSQFIQSNTNVLYFTTKRGPFQFEWHQLSKEAVRANRSASLTAAICGSSTLKIDSPFTFSSPGYPNGYADSLNCSWLIIPANPLTHVELKFREIDLEDYTECADYVELYSGSDLQNWQPLTKTCKKTPETIVGYKGLPYLRMDFITDTYINKTGFTADISTECGSVLTDRRRFVNITRLVNNRNRIRMECVWTIRVRQGRRIKLTFPDSILMPDNSNEVNCRNYFLVRNGINQDSPFLGKGKYCDNHITDVLETSSNRAYVKFFRNGFPDFRASFHYEEMVQGCSKEIVLIDSYRLDRQQTITSPNYPNLPNPHSECIWIIRAPLHKSISVHFWDKYDLATGSQHDICDHEYLQINDGSTEMSPLLGRYCGRTPPNSVHSSSNVMRVTYFTDLSEPHVGFKANLTIARCGGSYYDNEGTIKSPEFIKFLNDEVEVECVYTIEMPLGSTISLTVDRINLPDNDNCTEGTHLELQEIDAFSAPEDNVTDILHLCGTATNVYIVETNKLLIKFKIKKELRKSENFQLSYSSIGTRCGQTIAAAAGVLQTPGYPVGLRKPTMCSWRLKVTKGKRVKVEILDFNGGSPNTQIGFLRRRPGFPNRLFFANDFAMTSIIARVLDNPPAVLYSTDNTMAIDAFLLSITENRGFKLRFSSDEDSVYCHNKMYLEAITDPKVLIFSPDGNNAIYCAYNFKIEYNQTLSLLISHHEYSQQRIMYSPVWCKALSPLTIMRGEYKLLPQLMCQNKTQPSARFPYSIQMILSGSKQNHLKSLELQYQVFECGGFWPIDYYGKFVITEPVMTTRTGRLECAWFVIDQEDKIDSPDTVGGVQLEIQLTTDFKGKCEDEYLIVYNGPNQNFPHFGRFCQQSSMDPMVVTGGLFFEFITNNYNNRSTFNVTVAEGSGCGGKLNYPYRQLTIFLRDKNNIECIWELVTEPGFHLAAVFSYSFSLEDSPNCTKDYLKIQQRSPGEEWKDLMILCGRSRPNSVNTTEIEMRVILRTDNDTTGDGFTLGFERNCGGVFYANDEMQQIHSPGYPESYPANLTCNYTILPSKYLENPAGGNNLLVHFLDFEVEDAPLISCRFDNVTIHTIDYYGNMEQTVLCGKKSNYMIRASKAITLILRTDDSFNSKGFLFEYGPNKCGGTITNSTVISSPKDYNSDKYPRSTVCIWHLNAPENYKILLKFEELDFESQSLCTFDGLQIYKGSKAVDDQRLAKLCGNLTNHLKFMQIPQNNGLLVSYSDMHDPSKGFRVLVTFIKNCDRNIFLSNNNSSYVFNSYSEQYTNNLDCSWIFSTTSERQLSIEFNNFHIEDSMNCKNDYLEVRDGNGMFADLIGKFCGHNLPPTLVSSGRAMLLRFVTDMKETSGGFAAVIKSTPTLCGQQSFNLENNQTAIIKSPDDGSGKYPISISCIWKVQSGTFIHFEFDKLDLEGPDSNHSCSNDYLKIINSDDVEMIEKGYGSKLVFNGINRNSISSGYDFLAEHIYCGSQKPSDYFSGSKTVFIKFRSNENVTKSGFNIKATPAHGCYRNFTGVHGSIRLEEYVEHCDVFIRSPQNTTLSLYYRDATFTEYDCLKEYIEVFDVHSNTSLQKICSYTEVGKSLFSLTNELRLHVQLSGYYTQLSITYLASTESPGCGGDMYNTAGLITSPYYPQNIRNNSDCLWNIRVPSNMQVLLKFLVFDLGAKSTCHTDYVQIIEHDEAGVGKVMRQFCGEDNPQSYKSNKSFLTVRFHKTVNYDGTGWVMTFEGDYSNFKIV